MSDCGDFSTRMRSFKQTANQLRSRVTQMSTLLQLPHLDSLILNRALQESP